MKCEKGLHEMTPENTITHQRSMPGDPGKTTTVRKCMACRKAFRTTEPTYKHRVDDRQAEMVHLFGPYRTDGAWRDRAACIGEEPDTMHPTGRYNSKEVKELKERNCSWCPVRDECLIDGLAVPTHGIRGGLLLPGELLIWDETDLLRRVREGVKV